MAETHNVGRWVGGAMLVTFVVDLLSNFKLQGELFAGGGFIVNAATHPLTIGSIVVLGMLSSLLSAWIAAILWTRYGRAFPGLAGTYFALVVGVLAASVMELSTFIAMRDLSELFVGAGAEAGTRFETASAVIRGLRNGMHFTGKVLGGASVMAFFLLLFRARLVPRWMSAFGALAALLQMASVARPLFGGGHLRDARPAGHCLCQHVDLAPYKRFCAWYGARCRRRARCVTTGTDWRIFHGRPTGFVVNIPTA